MREPVWVSVTLNSQILISFDLSISCPYTSNMISRRRINDFQGTDSEYIAYLESIVRQAIPVRSPPSPPRSVVRYEAVNDSDGDEAPLNSLKFIPYEPETNEDDPPSAKRQRIQQRWEREMNDMLHHLSVPDWSSEREGVGLSSSDEVLAAFDIIIGTKSRTELAACDTDLSVVCYNPSNAVLQLLETFGSATAALKVRKTFAKQIYLFHEFVFVSTCCVALHHGADLGKVDEIMQRYISDSGGRNLDRLRSGALWANRMMSALAADGFGHMAYELFVVRKL